jgi:hypothetical protein
MGSAGYTWEKCFTAVSILAGGAGGLRERLSDAWVSSLTRLEMHPIPWPELREKFERIRDQILPEISAAPDAVRKMEEHDLRKLAEEIVSLYDGACREYARDPNANERSVSARTA